jgi:hypothetical protein
MLRRRSSCLLGDLLSLGGHLGLQDALAKLRQILVAVAFAKLLLNRLHLLAQHRFALATGKLILDLLVDALFGAHYLGLALQHRQHRV